MDDKTNLFNRSHVQRAGEACFNGIVHIRERDPSLRVIDACEVTRDAGN